MWVHKGRSRPPAFSPAAPGAPIARVGLPTPSEGPGAPKTLAQPPVLTAVAPPPLRATAWADRTLDRNSQAATTGDRSPEPQPQPPRPKRMQPSHTHHGTPSRVRNADARPTLTAVVAAAEGWSSQTPSPHDPPTLGQAAAAPAATAETALAAAPPPGFALPASPRPAPGVQPIGPRAWGAELGAQQQVGRLSAMERRALAVKGCTLSPRLFPAQDTLAGRTVEASLRNKSPFASSSRDQVLCRCFLSGNFSGGHFEFLPVRNLVFNLFCPPSSQSLKEQKHILCLTLKLPHSFLSYPDCHFQKLNYSTIRYSAWLIEVAQ